MPIEIEQKFLALALIEGLQKGGEVTDKTITAIRDAFYHRADTIKNDWGRSADAASLREIADQIILSDN